MPRLGELMRGLFRERVSRFPARVERVSRFPARVERVSRFPARVEGGPDSGLLLPGQPEQIDPVLKYRVVVNPGRVNDAV